MLHLVHHRYTVYDGPAPEATSALEQEGHALVRDFLDTDQVEALRAEIHSVFETTPPDLRAGSPTPEHASMFRYQMVNRSALCQKVSADPRLLQIVEPLLGPESHLLSSTAWHNPAGADHAPRGQEWHSDAGPHIPRAPGVPWPDNIPYPVFAIATHLFLEDCELADGPTAVVPKSHMSGLAPPKEREWDLELEYEGHSSLPYIARAGDLALFVSDVWHRRLPPSPEGTGRFFLQTNYARRDLAQRILPTAQVNHASPEAIQRATSERERLLLGLHPERFYDG
ncbi:MAG: phytanoyl-CoA dioxygenase family protein [Planctomycetota bacterium]